jgi:hypothetical protein
MNLKELKTPRYARISEMEPGTRFIGNRQNNVCILLQAHPDLEIIPPDHISECTVPVLHERTNTICVVAPHEIVELVLGIKMNQQEMFNIVWEHAKKKQKSLKSSSYRDSCAYRGNDGAKCFIGACIKDEDYDPSFDDDELSTAFEDLVRNHPKMREYFKDIPLQFGTDLQDIHDAHPVEKWEYLLRNFAFKYKLSIPA